MKNKALKICARKGFRAAGLGIAIYVLTGAAPAQTKVVDLWADNGNLIGIPDSVSPNPLLNPAIAVNGKVFGGDTRAPLANFASYPHPAHPFANGFTIAVMLSAFVHSGFENIVTLKGIDGVANLTVLRDAAGRLILEKRLDPTGTDVALDYYRFRVWDPVSPCATLAAPVQCLSDTLYLSFRPNGQIAIDEIAAVSSGASGSVRYDWQSGLVNYGYPVASYPAGTPGGGADVDFLSLGAIEKGATIRTPSALQANMLRFAVWDDLLSKAGILASQAVFQAPLTLNPAWISCSSGSFQVNQTGDDPRPGGTPVGLTTQYHPSDMLTPCGAAWNVPTAPTNVTASPSTGEATVLWGSPASFGYTPVTGYQISWSAGLYTGAANASATTNTAFLPLLQPATYAVSVKAANTIGWGPAQTVLVTPQQPTWIPCATQGGTCSFGGDGVVRFGIPGNPYYFYQNAAGGIPCTAGSFGGYPFPLVPTGYECNWMPAARLPSGPDAQWTFCAFENDTCSAPAGSVVAYGALGRFYRKNAASLIYMTCNNSAFFDAANGTPKACFVLRNASVPAGPAGFVFCSLESTVLKAGSCKVSAPGVVAYGVSGFYFFRSFSGDTPCDNDTFGDAQEDESKACFYAPNTSLPAGPIGSTYCAKEGEKCLTKRKTMVSYGVDGSFITNQFEALRTLNCVTGELGDPSPRADKACFWYEASETSLPGLYECANAGDNCIFAGPQVVHYGNGSQYISHPFGGTFIVCSGSVFAVSFGGTNKCYTQLPTSLPAGPPTFSFKTTENDVVRSSTGGLVAIGLKTPSQQGRFVTRPLTSTTNCEVSSFVFDPDPNALKSCFTASSSDLAGNGYTRAAGENTSFSVSGTRYVAFGANGYYSIKEFTNTYVSCDVTTFGDPIYGATKSCYLAQ